MTDRGRALSHQNMGHISNPYRRSSGENGTDHAKSPQNPAILRHPARESDKNNRECRDCESCEVAASEYRIVVTEHCKQIENGEKCLDWVLLRILPESWIERHRQHSREHKCNPAEIQGQVGPRRRIKHCSLDDRVERDSEQRVVAISVAVDRSQWIAKLPGQWQHVERSNGSPDQYRTSKLFIFTPIQEHDSNSYQATNAKRTDDCA